MTTIGENGIPATDEVAIPIPANEWVAADNMTLYTEANGRFAKEWRERFAADPKVQAVIRRSFDY